MQFGYIDISIIWTINNRVNLSSKHTPIYNDLSLKYSIKMKNNLQCNNIYAPDVELVHGRGGIVIGNLFTSNDKSPIRDK